MESEFSNNSENEPDMPTPVIPRLTTDSLDAVDPKNDSSKTADILNKLVDEQPEYCGVLGGWVGKFADSALQERSILTGAIIYSAVRKAVNRPFMITHGNLVSFFPETESTRYLQIKSSITREQPEMMKWLTEKLKLKPIKAKNRRQAIANEEFPMIIACWTYSMCKQQLIKDNLANP